MQLIYILLNKKNEVLFQNSLTGLLLPNPKQDVDESYGFDSPENDNDFFNENCGRQVYRRTIIFQGEFCLAVFDVYDDKKPDAKYIWMNYNNIPDSKVRELLNHIVQNNYIGNCAPWISPEGFEPYFTWANEAIKKNGLLINNKIIQIKNAYVSSVFIFPTNAGNLFLKIPSTVYLNAPQIERFWSEQTYGLPGFMAISPDGKAALTYDIVGDSISNDNISAYEDAMCDWAKKQRLIAQNNTYTDTLRLLPDCTLQNMVASFDYFINNLSILSSWEGSKIGHDKTAKAITKLDTVRSLTDKLHAYNIPNTLCHGDIRPANMYEKNGRFLLFDWGMSFFSHPFYDLCHLLYVIRRQLSDVDRDRIAMAYLKEWTVFDSIETLKEAYAIVDQLKFFVMIYQDCEWLIEIIKACSKVPECSFDSWLFNRRLYYFSRAFDQFLSEF